MALSRHPAIQLLMFITVLGSTLLTSCSMTTSSDAAISSDAANVERISDEEVIERFHYIWADPKKSGFWANTWFGIPTVQNPMDAWITQEIIFEVKPDYIIEAGSYQGGSAALWATILEQVNPEGKIISIDVEYRTAEAEKLPIVQRRVEYIVGSSTDPEIVADIRARTEGKKVLVILDSLHTKDHVLDELNMYGDMVSIGSYMIVQDSAVNGHPLMLSKIGFTDFGPGPWEAVEAFIPTTDKFVIDKDKERLLLTDNPNGFLKRIR